MTRFKKTINTLAILAIAATISAQNAAAQCASGDCGSVGYSDGNGGYVSGGFADRNYSTTTGIGSTNPYYVQPLFENYFTQGNANRADAGMYISPVGVPGWVGHTYITNQTLYPHEFLYAHTDRYHSYYDGGRGYNRTSAKYYSPPVRSGLSFGYRALSLPR